MNDMQEGDDNVTVSTMQGGKLIKIHRIFFEKLFGTYLKTLQRRDGTSDIILPLFPTQTRPFNDKVLETLRTFLHFTTIIEANLDEWKIIDLLEFALVLQYFDPDCFFIEDVLKLVLSKLARINETNGFTEIWDVIIALYVLDALYHNAQYFLPQLLFFPHCSSVGMCGDLPKIVERYQTTVNKQVPAIKS